MKRLFFVSVIFITTLSFFVSCGPPTNKRVSGVVSGIVVEINYIAEASSFKSSSIKNTIVKFKDGRVRAFNGISKATFQKGKKNIIAYNRKNKILSVEIR